MHTNIYNSNLNEKGKRQWKGFAEVCRFIKEQNTLHNGEYNKHKLTFNTECVPKGSGHVKSLLIYSKLLYKGQRGASNNICRLCAAWETK